MPSQDITLSLYPMISSRRNLVWDSFKYVYNGVMVQILFFYLKKAYLLLLEAFFLF